MEPWVVVALILGGIAVWFVGIALDPGGRLDGKSKANIGVTLIIIGGLMFVGGIGSCVYHSGGGAPSKVRR